MNDTTKTTAALLGTLTDSQSRGLGRYAARVQTAAIASGRRRELDKNEAWLKDRTRGAQYDGWMAGWADELADMA